VAIKESIDKGSKWQKIIFIGLGIVVLLAIMIALFVGLESLKKFFAYLFGFLFFLGVLFLCGYLFYILFIKVEFKDIPAQWRKKLEMAARLVPNQMLGKLYLTGDSKHNTICYGKYLYLRIYMPKVVKNIKLDKKGQPMLDEWERPITEDETHDLPIDVFILVQKGFFKKLFNEPVFILAFPEDHDYSSIFNDVYIKGFNIVPLDNYFYTIDRHNLDVDITKALATNYHKEAIFEQLRDLDKLIKGAINLDSRFQKDKERGSEFELPQIEQMKGK
jgi:hypothetical protein